MESATLILGSVLKKDSLSLLKPETVPASSLKVVEPPQPVLERDLEDRLLQILDRLHSQLLEVVVGEDVDRLRRELALDPGVAELSNIRTTTQTSGPGVGLGATAQIGSRLVLLPLADALVAAPIGDVSHGHFSQ